MTYVSVKEDTEVKLHLVREPSTKAWAILAALVALGFGAAYYSVDYLLWKLAYVSGAVFVGLSCMEDWEECILDKSSGKVTFRKQSLVQKMFQATKGQKVVVANLSEVVSVRVEEEEVKYGGVGYMVIMLFSTGYSLGITETAIMEQDKTEFEQVRNKICTFLKLDADPLPSPVSDEGVPEDSSSTSDESFEHVDKAELVDEGEGGEELPKDEEETKEDKKEESMEESNKEEEKEKTAEIDESEAKA